MGRDHHSVIMDSWSFTGANDESFMNNYQNTMNSYLEKLDKIICHSITKDQFAWYCSAQEQLKSSEELLEKLATLITQTRRNIGNAPLSNITSPISTDAGDLYIKNWTATDAVRIALLLLGLSVVRENRGDIVPYLYRMGDEAENTSIIKGLSLYNNDDNLKPVALEAGRTNSQVLFSALAQNNPYPAAYYTDHEFNQMVLKALFIGIGIDSISGLIARANPELSRMAEDYLEERVAAGREIPVDIWLALAPYCSVQGEQLLIYAISDKNAGHRHFSASAIMYYGLYTADINTALENQLKNESNNIVRNTISRALDARKN